MQGMSSLCRDSLCIQFDQLHSIMGLPIVGQVAAPLLDVLRKLTAMEAL